MDSKVFNVDRDMVVFGVRYAIGRQTFAPTIAIENVKSNIEKIDNNTIDIIIRDIGGHLGSLGMECDKLTWLNFVQYLKEEKTSRLTSDET